MSKLVAKFSGLDLFATLPDDVCFETICASGQNDSSCLHPGMCCNGMFAFPKFDAELTMFDLCINSAKEDNVEVLV